MKLRQQRFGARPTADRVQCIAFMRTAVELCAEIVWRRGRCVRHGGFPTDNARLPSGQYATVTSGKARSSPTLFPPEPFNGIPMLSVQTLTSIAFRLFLFQSDLSFLFLRLDRWFQHAELNLRSPKGTGNERRLSLGRSVESRTHPGCGVDHGV
ncbi:hypothetical protein [Burkholderia ambifaria]|uniref:hypothetical protein n=1 Tax=Burkholderia ambifaria TaxID=152480 RepID=UPI0015894617|nr:hypothetical protein [Burkholderia ambifaria]